MYIVSTPGCHGNEDLLLEYHTQRLYILVLNIVGNFSKILFLMAELSSRL